MEALLHFRISLVYATISLLAKTTRFFCDVGVEQKPILLIQPYFSFFIRNVTSTSIFWKACNICFTAFMKLLMMVMFFFWVVCCNASSQHSKKKLCSFFTALHVRSCFFSPRRNRLLNTFVALFSYSSLCLLAMNIW